MRRAIALILLLCSCSWLTVVPPEPPDALSRRRPVCTRSVGAPIADLVIGAALAGAADFGMTHFNECHRESGCPGAFDVVALTAVVAWPWVLSSIYGFRSARRCRKAGPAEAAPR